jgi:NAD(P)-dependent dehydrogenase (short-subunit alcohol dehydrogenase family)
MDNTIATPKKWGFDAAQLATMSTVFRPDLFAGQSLLISGGGSGMGRATAFLAARLGANVMICGRTEDKLRQTAFDIGRLVGREVAWKVITIRDPGQVNELMDEAFERFGHIDALVNSAGGQFSQNAIDFSTKGWNAVIDTNLNGTWWMMQAAARRWRDRAQPGCIISIVANFARGIPQSSHTAAARAGVVFLSKSVAVEWAPHNIRVNCIAPGTIETEGLDNYPSEYLTRIHQGNPMQRAGDAWDIAESVAYLAGPSGKFITGELLQVDGGAQLWGTTWPLGVPNHFKI